MTTSMTFLDWAFSGIARQLVRSTCSRVDPARDPLLPELSVKRPGSWQAPQSTARPFASTDWHSDRTV